MSITLKRSGSVVLVALIAIMAALGLIASAHFGGHGTPQQPLRPGNSLHLGDRSIAGDSIAGD